MCQAVLLEVGTTAASHTMHGSAALLLGCMVYDQVRSDADWLHERARRGQDTPCRVIRGSWDGTTCTIGASGHGAGTVWSGRVAWAWTRAIGADLVSRLAKKGCAISLVAVPRTVRCIGCAGGGDGARASWPHAANSVVVDSRARDLAARGLEGGSRRRLYALSSPAAAANIG